MRIIFVLVAFSLFCFASSEHLGIVYSKQEVKLSFPLDGIVDKVYAKDGERVEAGDAILKLDDRLQKLEVQRAKEVYKDNSEYLANKANLKITKGVLESTRQLYEETSSVSKDELNNLQMQYESLKGKVLAYESRKKQEELAYKSAKNILSKYTLKTPINGIVTNSKYDKGEWAKVGEVAVVVVDIDNCYVELNIDEPIARSIKINEKVQVISNNSNIKKTAFVYYIAPLAESTSALVKVRVMFKNDKPKITPGIIAKVIFNDVGKDIAK